MTDKSQYPLDEINLSGDKDTNSRLVKDEFARMHVLTMRTLVRLRRLVELRGRQREIEFLNLQQFFYLWFFDFQILSSNLLFEETGIIRNVYARIVVMQIYEHFFDMAKLLSSSLRHVVGQLSDPEKTTQTFMGLHSQHHEIKQKYGKTFKEIRVNVVAHRHHDARRQIELMESLDESELADVAIRINKWCLELNEFFGAINEELFQTNSEDTGQ